MRFPRSHRSPLLAACLAYGLAPRRAAPRHALSLDVSTTRLGTGIKDSPLVERRNVSRVSFGYVYRF